MIKKFFSIILLTTTLAVSSLFSKALTLKNDTSKDISNITFSYSTGRFESSDICSRILHSGQEGVSELENTTIINVGKITYTITTSHATTDVTYDFEGKEIGLPAVILLSDKAEAPVIIHDNEEARIEAEKNKIVNQAAAAARSAKDTVSNALTTAKDNLGNALTTAKDWALSATKTVTTTAQDVAHKAKIITNATAQKVADATSDVQDEGSEFRRAAQQRVDDVTQAIKDVVSSTTQQASDIKDTAHNAILHTKHAVQEKGQELGHSAVENALETYNAGKEIVSKIEHKIEEARA